MLRLAGYEFRVTLFLQTATATEHFSSILPSPVFQLPSTYTLPIIKIAGRF